MITSPFDALVVRLNPVQRKQEWKGKEVYRYNPRTAKAERYRPNVVSALFDRDGMEYYRLAPQETVTCPPIEILIKDTTNQQRLLEALFIIQRVETERISDFVTALAENEGTPFEIFTNLVSKWIQDFANQKRLARLDVYTSFSSGTEKATAARKECVKYCQDQALKILGLKLSGEIRLPEADLVIDPISLRFSVFTKDCEEELSVNIELTMLPPDNETKRNLALQQLIPIERIHETLKRRAAIWFRSNCTLEEFCYEPAKVRIKLEAELRPYVEDDLYRILFNFRVTCSASFEKEFPIREDYDVTCEVEPGQTKVPVRHRVLLDRKNIAELRKSSIPNLEQWVEKTLTRHTRAVLFGKKYVDVILKFDEIVQEIKQSVKEDVKRIGFIVNHLMTIPTDEQMRSCIEGILSFETDVLSFKTKDSRVEFSLSVSARVKLDNLEKAKDFLRPGDYLRDQFKRATEEEAGRVVRQLEPEWLYTMFTEKISEGKKEINSPEITIKDAIAQRLKTEFGAITEILILNQEPTELTQLFSAIQPPKNQNVNVTIESRGDMGEKLNYKIGYRVESIPKGGWRKFQEITQNCFNKDVPGKAKEIIDAITQRVSDNTTEFLETLPPHFLLSPSPDMTQNIQRTALSAVINEVSNDFGLDIKITSFRRDLSKWEAEARNRKKDDYDTIINKLNAFRVEHSKLLTKLAPDDPTIEELSKKINNCNEELKQFSTGHETYFFGSEKAIPAPRWNQLKLPQRK